MCPCVFIFCREVRERLRPRVHIFGHIHEGYGVYEDKELGITYINASTSTVQYRASNAPLVFDLPLDQSQPLRWVSEVGITQLKATADGLYVAESEGSEGAAAQDREPGLPPPIPTRCAPIHPPRLGHPSATPPLASPVSHCSSSSSLSSLAMSGSWCGDETVLASLMNASSLASNPTLPTQHPTTAAPDTTAPASPRENGNGHHHPRDEPPSPVHAATVGAT
jgi:hypothetical protein